MLFCKTYYVLPGRLYLEALILGSFLGQDCLKAMVFGWEFKPPAIEALRNRLATCASRQSSADTLLTGHLLINRRSDLNLSRRSGSSQTIHTYKPNWLIRMIIFQALFLCDILILGRSPVKWRLRPDITVAVEWDVKHQFKQQTNEIKHFYKTISIVLTYNTKFASSHFVPSVTLSLGGVIVSQRGLVLST